MPQHTAARIANRTKIANMLNCLSLGKEATNVLCLSWGLTPGSELDARPLNIVTQNVPGCRSVTLHGPSDGTLPHKRHTAAQTLSQEWSAPKLRRTPGDLAHAGLPKPISPWLVRGFRPSAELSGLPHTQQKSHGSRVRFAAALFKPLQALLMWNFCPVCGAT